MNNLVVERLLENLKHDNPVVRGQATSALWQRWFWQKGMAGMAQLRRSQELLEAGEVAEAEQVLSQTIAELPDFAEAWNRRAVLYYTQQQFEKAIADCQQTLALVPYHFGALHGLGLCQAAVGNHSAAVQAFRDALAVQPHALINQRLLLESMAHL